MRLDSESAAYCELLAQELKRRRLSAGLSANRLAEMSGLSQPMIGFIEKGTCIPTAASLYRIALSLKTPLAEIITVTDSQFKRKFGAKSTSRKT